MNYINALLGGRNIQLCCSNYLDNEYTYTADMTNLARVGLVGGAK